MFQETTRPTLPKGLIDLEEREYPVIMVRQHWVVFRDPFLIAFFVPFMLLFGVFMVHELKGNVGMYLYVTKLLLVLSLGSFLLGIFLFLWKMYLWKRTFYLITNLRIILVTRYSLFHHDDRETSLNMIQDVKAEVKGLQPAMYGFGDVVVQVSSQDAKLVLEKVAKPREVQKVIVREAHLKEGTMSGTKLDTITKNDWDAL